MSTITWIKPSGNAIEVDSNFNVKALKALGWKKKPGPKKKELFKALKPSESEN